MIFREYDAEADAVFVRFREIGAGEVARVREPDDRRLVHLDRRGEEVAVEFLEASGGIELDGVPRADEVAAVRSFPRLAPAA